MNTDTPQVIGFLKVVILDLWDRLDSMYILYTWSLAEILIIFLIFNLLIMFVKNIGLGFLMGSKALDDEVKGDMKKEIAMKKKNNRRNENRVSSRRTY